MKFWNMAWTVFPAILALAACGGGGGGSTGQNQQPQFSRATAASASGATVRNSANRSATNLPRFGSVTQSSNAGSVAGVTGDAASTSFNGRHVRLTIRRADGSRLSFNGATDRVASETYDAILPGHTFRGDAMLKETATSVSAALTYTNWNNADSNDYLAGGYWIHVEGSVSPPAVTGAEIGSFVDGPELRGTPTLRQTGTATYTGLAAGAYLYQSSQGTQLGEASGIATLQANFGTNTISGCIGCIGGVVVTGVAVDSAGRATDFLGVPVPARLRMGAAPIQSNGRFQARNVSLERDDARVTSSSGSWGGRFSTRPAQNGDPRLAGGTAGARWTESTGAQGVITSAWYAVKQ